MARRPTLDYSRPGGSYRPGGYNDFNDHFRRQGEAMVAGRDAGIAHASKEYYSEIPVWMGGDLALPAVRRTPIYVREIPDPRRHPHKEFGRGPTQAERALQQQADDAAERYKLKGLLDKVFYLGLQYGPAKPLGDFLDLIDVAEGLFAFVQRAGQTGNFPDTYPGWYKTGECAAPAGGANRWIGHNAGFPVATQCLGGQSSGPNDDPVTGPYKLSITDIEAFWPQCSNIFWYYTLFNYNYQHVASYARGVNPNPTTVAALQFIPSGGPLGFATNPNVARLINATLQPFSAPAVELVAIPQQAVVIQTHTGGSAPPRAPPSIVATRSRPPEPGVKERKTKIGRGVAAIFSALDKLSEASEVVDAFYKALPKDVRDRWDRPDRPGDQMGQYGVSGADWKLQALYHNWGKVDIQLALTNVLVNEISDRLYGAAYGARSDIVSGKWARKRKRTR